MDVHVARQPIFDRKKKVYGYELLFRLGLENKFTEVDGDLATSIVITNSFLVIGMEKLTRGKKAFINFTGNLLLDETATILPKDFLVVEILENIDPSSEIISACRKLKDSGYALALDDFIFEPKFTPLIMLADIIKVDFTLSDEEEIRSLIDKFGKQKGIQFLAEKVETPEQFQVALDMGFAYFQGYFFSKPIIISSKDIEGYKLNVLNILHELNKPDANFGRIEGIIKHDVSISYKILRFINSAFFGFQTNIQSIKQALTLLGLNDFRKWLYLIIVKSVGTDKPDELMVSSIVRARFCESLAGKTPLKNRNSELFFLGMFSMIDTFMDRSMEDVLKKLSLSDDITKTLLGEDGEFKNILDLALSYERADWETVAERSRQLNIDLTTLADLHMEAMDWAYQIFDSLSVTD